jgi:predicted nuclease of predicted toxin-antitoxin system
MRILLDECLPRRLKDELPEHEVRTVPDAGWRGRKNGELLQLAAGCFDVFVTVDAGIEYQQNPASIAVGVVALKARSNRIEDLRPLMPRLRQLIATIAAGQWVTVGE